PDALSRPPPDTILPLGRVVGAVTWGVEAGVEVPVGCPAGLLFVPDTVRTAVFQWGHSSKLVSSWCEE
ncbi:hypothetical protein M9458_009096, partial [Cirrhinus mrigala]